MRYNQYISEFEALTVEQVIDRLSNEFDFTVDMESAPERLLVQDGVFVPSKIDARLVRAHGGVVRFSLAESDEKEFMLYGNRFRISFDGDGVGDEIRKMAVRACVLLADEIPDVFLSMEHLTSFLSDFVDLSVAHVPDSMLISLPQVMMRLFEGWRERGTVSWNNASEPRKERIRIEVKENSYKYMDANAYRVFERDGALCAVGIGKEVSYSGEIRYTLRVFSRTKDARDVERLFDERYESLLYENVEIRGGKYTGDQRIVRLSEKLTLDDIVLEDSVRDKLQREIFGFFALEPVYRMAGIPFKRGVALYGPPGTGKTMIAKIIASTMEETVIWVKAGDIATVEDINRIFRLARTGRPSVVILEDIDFYTEDREAIHADKVGVASLMSHLDGLEENDGILVVITTNRIDSIEKAIVERPGRIDARIFMGELGREAVTRLVERKLGSFERTFESFRSTIPEMTTMTGAMTVEFSTAIIRNAIGRSEDPNVGIVITEKDVQKALKDFERNENVRKIGFRKAAC